MFPGLPGALGSALRQTHSMRVTVDVLDLDHKPIATISNRIIDGSVNVSLEGEVTRSATLTVLDPDSRLDFDSDSPADGAIYADRMLRIKYGIRHADLNGGAWVDVPIFTGPVVNFSRDGIRVTIECQGKELLARGLAWRAKVYKGGQRKIAVIEDVMRTFAGERFFNLPTGGATLPVIQNLSTADHLVPADRSVTPNTQPWAFVTALAKGMGVQLFYDGEGRLVLRQWPGASAYTFATGTGGAIRTAPKVTFTTGEVRNAFRVTGKFTLTLGMTSYTGPSTPSYLAVAKDSHPLSPRRLGRNGVPRYLAEFITDDSVGSVAEAKQVAETRLEAALMSVVNITCDTLVVPHLDAGDVITVKTDDYSLSQRLNSFSIPLTAGSPMTLGYNRRLTKATPRGIK